MNVQQRNINVILQDGGTTEEVGYTDDLHIMSYVYQFTITYF